VVVVNIPSVVGGCTNLTVDARSSYGRGAYPWKNIIWTVSASDLSNTSKILSLLPKTSTALTSRVTTIPQSLLKNITYTFSLRVTNFQDVTGQSSATTMYDLSSLYATVTPISSLLLSTNPSLSFSTAMSVKLPRCVPSSSQLTYRWDVFVNSNTSPEPSLSSTSKNPKTFSVPPYTFIAGNTYRLKFSAVLTPGGTATSETTVTVNDGPIVARIAGGSRRSVSQTNLLVLDATGSSNGNISPTLPQQLAFNWSCSSPTNMPCHSIFSSHTSSTPTLTLSTLSPGAEYILLVQVSGSGGRSDTATLSLTTAASSTVVNVDSSSSKFNINDILEVQGTISGNRAVTAVWSLVGGNSTLQPSDALTPLTASFSASEVNATVSYPLSINSGVFQAGASYTFRLRAGNVYSEYMLTARVPPHSGSFFVSPLVGFALSTDFLLSTSGWIADSSDFPLSYEFLYSENENDDSPLTLQSKSEVSSTSTILPSGLSPSYFIYLTLIVSGYTGTETVVFNRTQVLPVPVSSSALASALSSALVEAEGEADAGKTIQNVNIYASAANTVNCSLASLCSALHRSPCSSVPHTCGPCLRGYTGANGHFNGMCELSGSRRFLAITSCTQNSDCVYGSCANGSCAVGSKSCPSSSSGVCSGHGTCRFEDGPSEKPLEVCLADSLTCRAYCTCDTGYGGADCRLSSAELASASSLRSMMCNALYKSTVLVDPSSIQTTSLMRSFQMAYNPHEVSTANHSFQCVKSLEAISTVLDGTFTASRSVLSASTRSISKLLESRRVYRSLYDSTTESTVLKSTDVLTQKAAAGMVAGQGAVTLTSKNLKMSARYNMLSSLRSTDLSFSPAIGVEESHLILPSTGLDTCGYTGGYAKFAILEWGTSPYSGSQQMLSNILRFVAMNTSLQTVPQFSSSSYDLILKWSVPQNWSQATPNCSLLGVGSSALCPCRVSSYTSLNVSFVCSDVTTLCANDPSSGRRRLLTSDSIDILKSTDFSVVSVSTKRNPVVAAASSSVALDVTSGTSFFSIFLFMAVVGVLLFALWDSYERTSFNMNKRALQDANLPPPEFALKDAFSTHGVQGQSMVSFRSRPKDGKTPQVARDNKSGILNKPVDLLDSSSNSALYVQSLFKHHSILRMFTYGSLRVTRVLRFVCFCTNLLLIIFVTTLFYAIAFPSDNDCSDHTRSSDCVADESNWIDGDELCAWDFANLECSLRQPEGDGKFYLIACLVILAVLIIPISLIKWAFEYVYTKEILFAVQSEEPSQENQSEFTNIEEAHKPASLSNTPEGKVAASRMNKVISDVNNHAEVDEHVRNKLVIQHFIHDHLNPVERFFIKNHFFHLDHAKPETLGILLWIFTLIISVGLWIFFTVYIYIWLLDNQNEVIRAWGITLLFTWLLEVFFIEVIGVFLWHVIPLLFIRNKLRHIHDVISSSSSQETSTDNSATISRGRTLRHMVSEKPHDVSAVALAASRFEGKTANNASVMILNLDHSAINNLTKGSTSRSLDISPVKTSTEVPAQTQMRDVPNPEGGDAPSREGETAKSPAEASAAEREGETTQQKG